MPIFASDASQMSPRMQTVENDVKNDIQSGVHNQAPSFFSLDRKTPFASNPYGITMQATTHYFRKSTGKNEEKYINLFYYFDSIVNTLNQFCRMFLLLSWHLRCFLSCILFENHIPHSLIKCVMVVWCQLGWWYLGNSLQALNLLVLCFLFALYLLISLFSSFILLFFFNQHINIIRAYTLVNIELFQGWGFFFLMMDSFLASQINCIRKWN